MKAHLVLTSGNDVSLVQLGAEPATIGRTKDNAVCVDDPASSRRHCRVEPYRDGYRLVDLGSHNGTRVNGKKVDKKILESGDRIEIGATVVYFRVDPVPTAEGKPAKEAPPRDEPDRRYAADPRAKAGRLLARVFDEDGLDGLLELREYVENFVEERSSAISGRGTTRENLARLQEITRAITSELNLGKLLTLIVDSVIRLTKAERGFLLLRTRKGLEIRTARHMDQEAIRKPDEKLSHSITEEVATTGKPLVTVNAQTDERLSSSGSVADLKLRSVLAVALKVKDRVIGVLYVDNRFEEGVFSKVDLPLAEAFADQAAIAVENARLVAENQRRQDELKSAKDKVEELNRILNEKVRRQSAELLEVKQILRARQDEMEFKYSYENIVGESARMREVFRLLDRVTDSEVPVLIQGESGTGKELVARAIHFHGARRDGPFVTENCAAIPDNLLESELFGYMRGAFTGADRDKRGLLSLATGGTLFLDEIADMSLEMQGKLLRALEEGAIRPLGGKALEKVDVRVLAATNRDVRRGMAEGTFREDLYYRIAVISVTLPPLRDRREDIPLLVGHFLARFAEEKGRPAPEIADETLSVLAGYDWPGNVRQLRNEIQRAIALADRVIVPDILSEEIRKGSVPRLAAGLPANHTLKEATALAVQAVERELVREVLRQTGWKKSEAARRLGISRPTLDSKITIYDLKRSGG
ncbi:MAG: sigma 54-interacting transcriptional regulator [Planctomycetes bacterium]|nr:sigma 54-interacting transcriptional regulator [Planctomycetota bacterium]